MAYGPEEGLLIIESLDAGGALEGYYLLHAARADLLRRAGRPEEARLAYEQALELCVNPVEIRYLQRRLQEVNGGRDAAS